MSYIKRTLEDEIDRHYKHDSVTDFNSEVTLCNICMREIYLDDIQEEFTYLEGLGYVCLTTKRCIEECRRTVEEQLRR